ATGCHIHDTGSLAKRLSTPCTALFAATASTPATRPMATNTGNADAVQVGGPASMNNASCPSHATRTVWAAAAPIATSTNERGRNSNNNSSTASNVAATG